MKIFPDEQKLKEFITIGTDLQKVLKEVIQAEKKIR